jgi:hypothetical protein
MHPTHQQRERHVTRWRLSGQSRAAFCRAHGLPYYSFLAWIKRPATATPATVDEPGFIEMRRPTTLIAQRTESSSEATVVLACGLTLRVIPGTDADWIGRVVAAVRRC